MSGSTTAPKTQADGLPSAEALETYDDAVAGLELSLTGLDVNTSWVSFDPNEWGEAINREYRLLNASIRRLKDLRKPFNVTTVTVKKVVRA